MHKSEQRKQIRMLQKQLSNAYCSEADALIYQYLLSLPDFQKASTVFCFVNTAYEINTRPVLEYCWSHNKRTVVPKCIEKGIMNGYEIHSFEDLTQGAYDILEPVSSCPVVEKEQISFAVVPCLSCNEEGWRLGHGGGYYDRYLEHTHFPKAVICREKLMLKEIAHDHYDQKMDYVISEKGILSLK